MQIILSFIVGLLSVSVYAQEGTSSTSIQNIQVPKPAPVEDEDTAQVQTLKKIEITGSYIKRVDEEAPTPVQTISKETLKKSGYNSVADVLRDNAVTSGGAREDSVSGNPGAATTGIGPFGSDSILVLLDGNRLPKIGGDNSVDLNLIPMAAIERVEILKDGASALYGSDAIGGVINFITKKNYDGGSVTIGQMAAGEGGAARTDFTGTFGKTFKKGSVTGVVQYRHNEPLADADRSFTRITNLGTQGSLTAQEAQWTDQNGNNVSPNCPADQLVDGLCMFDFSKYSWNMPKIDQYSTLVSGEYRISEKVKSRTQGTMTYREVNTRLAPAPGNFDLTQAQATALGIPNIGPDGTTVYYRTLEAGTRDNNDRTMAYNVAQTFEGPIAGSWTWDVTGSYGSSRTRQDGRGYTDRRRLVDMLLNPTPGSWNPILPPGQKGDISSAVFNPYQVTASTQSELRGIATGQLADEVSMAVGTTAGWQTFRSEVDEVTLGDNNFGGNGGNGLGARNFQSMFTEVSYFPIETVEIGAAGRMDTYSDFGSTFNPKLSVSWQASEKLMLRTSVGTGFRAPNLGDLYSGGGLGYPSFRDTIGCAGAGGSGPLCGPRQYEVSTFSNQNLTQEKSIFMNVGFLAQPKANWNIESNLFYARVEDSVGGLDGTQMMRAASLFGEDFLASRYNIQIQRDSFGQILRVTMPSAFNIASSNRQGIDFRVTNQSKANFGKFPVDFIVDVNHMQFLKMEREAFPGLGVQNTADGAYFGNYFKNTANVSAIHNNHSLRVTGRTISGGDKSLNIGVANDINHGKLRTHTEFDLNYSKANIFKGGTLNLGVKNVFDTARPLDEGAQIALNTSVYDPIGRFFYTTLDYTF